MAADDEFVEFAQAAMPQLHQTAYVASNATNAFTAIATATDTVRHTFSVCKD